MALPPTAAAAPVLEEEVADVPVAENVAPVDVMDEGGEGGWQPFVTVMKNADGKFMLVDGDEPEEGMDPEGETFEDGPNLLKALMNRIEGGATEAADDAFEKGFTGEPPKAEPAPMA